MSQGKNVKESETKALHIISSKEFEQEVKEEAIIYALVIEEATPAPILSILPRWS